MPPDVARVVPRHPEPALPLFGAMASAIWLVRAPRSPPRSPALSRAPPAYCSSVMQVRSCRMRHSRSRSLRVSAPCCATRLPASGSSAAARALAADRDGRLEPASRRPRAVADRRDVAGARRDHARRSSSTCCCLRCSGSAVAYMLYFRLIADVGPTRAMTVTFLMPAFGMLWGWLFLDETITLPMLAGTALIVAGTAAVVRKRPTSLMNAATDNPASHARSTTARPASRFRRRTLSGRLDTPRSARAPPRGSSRSTKARFVAAIDRDFGHRSAHETRLAELYIVAAEARHAIRRLPRWMKRAPRRDAVALVAGIRADIAHQPLGVVGIISPWNYPVQLALAPAIAALAAGNRVMLKPSELTPATSALLAELVSASFREDEFAVVEGDADDRAGVRVAAIRSSVLHRFDERRPKGRAGGRRKPDTGHARARRQIAGAVRRRRGLRDGRAAAHRRQAAERRADVHRAGLRAGSGRATRRVRRSSHGELCTTVPEVLRRIRITRRSSMRATSSDCSRLLDDARARVRASCRSAIRCRAGTTLRVVSRPHS